MDEWATISGRIKWGEIDKYFGTICRKYSDKVTPTKAQFLEIMDDMVGNMAAALFDKNGIFEPGKKGDSGGRSKVRG
jgi:hypothetical protein